MDFKSGQFENTCVINDTDIFGSRILSNFVTLSILI